MCIEKFSIDLYSSNNNNKYKQNKTTMYTVEFYHNSKLVQEFEFATENQAVDCLMRHASDKSLNVREDQYYASSEGNKPETEIEIVQYS